MGVYGIRIGSGRASFIFCVLAESVFIVRRFYLVSERQLIVVAGIDGESFSSWRSGYVGDHIRVVRCLAVVCSSVAYGVKRISVGFI